MSLCDVLNWSKIQRGVTSYPLMSRCKLENTERKSNTHHGSNRIEPGSNQTVLDVWCKKLDSGHILLRQDDYRWIGSCGPSRACLSSCHGKSFNQERQLCTITRRLLPQLSCTYINEDVYRCFIILCISPREKWTWLVISKSPPFFFSQDFAFLLVSSLSTPHIWPFTVFVGYGSPSKCWRVSDFYLARMSRIYPIYVTANLLGLASCQLSSVSMLRWENHNHSCKRRILGGCLPWPWPTCGIRSQIRIPHSPSPPGPSPPSPPSTSPSLSSSPSSTSLTLTNSVGSLSFLAPGIFSHPLFSSMLAAISSTTSYVITLFHGILACKL